MADYISREAALDFHIPTYDLNISVQDERVLGDRFEEFLNSIPAADVRPVVRGKWIKIKYRSICRDCSFRGFASWNFCPNCGADMREES